MKRLEVHRAVVEGIPEAEIVSSDLPELGDLVADKPEGHKVEDAFDNVEVAVLIDRVHAPVKSARYANEIRI